MPTPELDALLLRTRTWMEQARERWTHQRQLAQTGQGRLRVYPALTLEATQELCQAWTAAYPHPLSFQDRPITVAQLPEAACALVVDLTVSLPKNRTRTLHQTWLDFLVDHTIAVGEHDGETRQWREIVTWATLSGLNPNRFNGLVTPIYRLADAGRVDVLGLLHAAGADLVMALSETHVAQGPGGRVGSTLLHRLVEMARREHERASSPTGPTPTQKAQRQATLLRTITYLAEQVPGSMTPDATGWDPVNHAQGDIRTLLMRVDAAPRIAARQATLAARPPAPPTTGRRRA